MIDLDRVAHADAIVNDLQNAHILFRQMHPGQQAPVFYQLYSSDLEDVAYTVHQVEKLLFQLDRMIDSLHQIRGEV